MFKRKKPKVSVSPVDLPLPFALVDQPRVFLDFLARYSKIPEEQRQLIARWVQDYSDTLGAWIVKHYGVASLLYANQITVEVATMFYQSINEQALQAESSLFDFLEKEVFGGDGADDPTTPL